MNASTRTLLLCTALIGAAGMAQAQATGLTRAAIESAYADFERIEIAFGPTQVKVEAIDAQTGQVIEAIYDRATGTLLKQETASVTGTVASGIEVKNRAEDFLRARASDDTTAPGQGGSVDDTHRGHDDGTDDDDGDDDSLRSSSQANAAGASDDDKGRGRGRSGNGGSDDDGARDSRGGDRSGKDGSGKGGSDDDGDED